MFQNRKNIILCSVILILVVFPFVMHWIRKNDSVNNINSIEYFDRRSSREIETSLYEKDLKIKHINAKFSYLPFPQDILIISSLTLSPDGKYIFISGGTVPHQKIYMAPFPPKSEADYRLLCDLPNVYDVIALQCSPFDKNKIGFFVMEECPPDGEKKMIGDGEVRASFYVISTIDKKMEIWYRSPIKKPTSFVLGGSQKKLFTFCWYKENEIICFVGNSWEIFRFTAKGERSLFQIFYDDDDRNKNKCIERKLFNDEKGNIYLLDVRVLAEKNKNSSTINTNQAFGMQGVLFLLDPKSNEFKCYSDPHIVASLSGSLCGNAANNSSWIAAIMGGKYGFSVIDVNNVDNRKNICLNNFPEHVVSYYPALTPDNSFVVCCLKTTEPSMVEYYGINKVPPRPMFNLVMFLLQ